jgi:probable HAF family extracellular repeat protein
MRKQSLFLLTVLLIALPATRPAAAIRYTVTDLGTLPGYDTSHPRSINNHGQIVGTADAGNHLRAVLFDPTGRGNNIDLGTLGGQDSDAFSINDLGQIVGRADSNDPNQSPHATLFDPNGTANNIDLGTLGGPYSCAVSNNNMGQIVGGAATVDGPLHPTVFNPNAAADNTDLGGVDAFVYSYALCVNNQGWIVGSAYNSGWWFDERAVLFDHTGSGNHVELGTLGGETSAAVSINDAGLIVGTAEDSSGLYYATIFDPSAAANNINLGTVEGYTYSRARSVNNKAQVVGSSETPWGAFRATLFDATGAGNNVDLNELINPSLGWNLTEATSINDNSWIVGRGKNPDGRHRAFLLTPAGPADFEPDTDVDLEDFAVLAAAWKTTPAHPNWNPSCDISDPQDQLIDERDLAVLAQSYLMPAP